MRHAWSGVSPQPHRGHDKGDLIPALSPGAAKIGDPTIPSPIWSATNAAIFQKMVEVRNVEKVVIARLRSELQSPTQLAPGKKAQMKLLEVQTSWDIVFLSSARAQRQDLHPVEEPLLATDFILFSISSDSLWSE